MFSKSKQIKRNSLINRFERYNSRNSNLLKPETLYGITTQEKAVDPPTNFKTEVFNNRVPVDNAIKNLENGEAALPILVEHSSLDVDGIIKDTPHPVSFESRDNHTVVLPKTLEPPLTYVEKTTIEDPITYLAPPKIKNKTKIIKKPLNEEPIKKKAKISPFLKYL